MRNELRTRILTNKIYEAVIKKVTVSDADIQAYYDKNPTKYQQPASREVRHILVKNEALAQKLHDQIQGGADFAKLAKKYTQDTASKADGGKFTAFKGAHGRALRRVRLLREDRRSLRSDQDGVRLAHHRGARAR